MYVADALDQTTADGEVFGDPKAAVRLGVHVVEQEGLVPGAELGDQIDPFGEAAEAGDCFGEVVPVCVGVDGDLCGQAGGEQAAGGVEVVGGPRMVVGAGDVERVASARKGAP